MSFVVIPLTTAHRAGYGPDMPHADARFAHVCLALPLEVSVRATPIRNPENVENEP